MPETGDIYRPAVRGTQAVRLTGEEELKASHPTHVESRLTDFRYLHLAPRHYLSPAVHFLRLEARSDADTDEQGVRRLRMFA